MPHHNVLPGETYTYRDDTDLTRVYIADTIASLADVSVERTRKVNGAWGVTARFSAVVDLPIPDVYELS